MKTKSIRPFIGSKDFDTSRAFYKELGFEEAYTSKNMIYFRIDDRVGFYLQRAYVKDWINNTMIFWEVENLDLQFSAIKELNLPTKFPGVKLAPIQNLDGGREFFLHDPSGVLWHIGEFNPI